jgi:aspartate carbamoyltransferase catalytic subunit
MTGDTMPEKRNVITVADLSNEEIEEIFALADSMQDSSGRISASKALDGKIMATLFYEPSTRTRLSFEAAMHRLGGSVLSCPDMKSSSAAKGETIGDTARVVSSYADILVVRHYWDGAAQVVADYAGVPVINAGDGSHEHPTQTLCDLYTLKREKGDLKGLTVAICGDLKHGRTIHSLVYALARFGVNVITLAARGLEIPQYVIERLESEFHYGLAPVSTNDLQSAVEVSDAVYLAPSQPHQLALFTQMDRDIEGRLKKLVSEVKPDAFYVTRKQVERIKNKNGDEDHYPKIGEEFLTEKRFKDTLVMHPLPRVDEIPYEMDRDRRGVYFKQAAYGVPVRMALLEFIFDSQREKKAKPKREREIFYQTPAPLPPQCANPNCVARNEAVSAPGRFEASFAAPGSRLVLRCFYCGHQLKARFVGHTKSKRYCPYDSALTGALEQWLREDELVVFDSIKQAEELGYEPYKTGRQRSIMGEREIVAAVKEISAKIMAETEDPDRLVIFGIRTRGAILASRIAAEIEAQSGRKIPLAEIEIYGSEEGIRWVMPALEGEAPAVRDREAVLVDDVIQTGATVNSALSIIFKSGRPRSVRLAALIDRGHRELPVRPNYVGKHIPSSERERVRVKLREVEQDEKDMVVIYSIGPAETREAIVTG